MTEQLWRVAVPYACFGLVARDGRVVKAAPIARWAVGRPLADVLRYYRARKQGAVQIVVEAAR